MTTAPNFRSGFIAIIGRPNSGKSTLLNTVLGQELSIVSKLPQTTWKNTKGIFTDEKCQLIFIDTPGIHQEKHAYNKSLYRQSTTMFHDGGIDVIAYLVDLVRHSGAEEDLIVKMVLGTPKKKLIVFNKTDLCPDVGEHVRFFFERYPQLKEEPYITLSANDPSSKTLFINAILPMVPEGPQYYPDDEPTDSTLRFFAAELIRKQIIRLTREELPHASFVEILQFKEHPDRYEVDAVIHVETAGQKGIIIGNKGSVIKAIRKHAKQDLAALAGIAINLTCHVTVTPGWRDSNSFLTEYGLS